MSFPTVPADQADLSKIESLIDQPEYYLKNLEEYRKMLELLSLNQQLTEMLGGEDF